MSLRSQPSKLTPNSLSQLLNMVDHLNVCPGHPGEKFVGFLRRKKGVLRSRNGDVTASLNNHAPVLLNGVSYTETVRTTSCELLVHGIKCCSCLNFRPTLRSSYNRSLSRQSGTIADIRSHVNIRYMLTPEKAMRMKKMKKRTENAELEVTKLRKKIQKITCECGESLDNDLQQDLLSIMAENTQCVKTAFPEGSFRRLFWEQQLDAAKVTDARQVRWHPLLIQWCLNLKLMSSATYHATRTAGFIRLPSERTLRDYTHYFKSRPGFQREVNEQLQKETSPNNLSEQRKYCGILLDEMKIKENLVYDKFTGGVIGFINLGNINDELLSFEQEFLSDQDHRPIANHLLVLMVRGIFFKLEFPLAHFGTKGHLLILEQKA